MEQRPAGEVSEGMERAMHAPLDEHDNAFAGLPMIELAEPLVPSFLESAAARNEPPPGGGLFHRPPLFAPATRHGSTARQEQASFAARPAPHNPFAAVLVQDGFDLQELAPPGADDLPPEPDLPFPQVPEPAAAIPFETFDTLGGEVVVLRRVHLEAFVTYAIIAASVALLVALALANRPGPGPAPVRSLPAATAADTPVEPTRAELRGLVRPAVGAAAS